jgi:hypothetical protein
MALVLTNGGSYDFCLSDLAASPLIDLAPGAANTELSFWCNWETLEDECAYDTRHLRVLDASKSTTLLDVCFQAATTCGPANVWHQHSIPLDPAWGQVHLGFWFDVKDDLFNDGWGWAVDDLVVSGDCGPTQTYCTAKLNSVGCAPSIFSTGVPSASGSLGAFRVHAQNVINKQSGVLIWSFTEGATPFGGGTLCLGGTVIRTTGQNSGGNASPPVDCSGTYAYQFTPEYMSDQAMLPGTTVHTQYWSRDPGFSAPNSMGLTAGLRFTVCN